MKFTREGLSQLLRNLADAVESGDSMEGSLQYMIADGSALEVTASVRTGNLMGQGGCIVIPHSDEG